MGTLAKTLKGGTFERETSLRVGRFRYRGASLGLSASSAPELIRQVEHGFSFGVLRQLESNTGLSSAVLVSIAGIPERTLARRRTAGKFEPEESERLLRISGIFEKAVELFEGDITSAVDWLMRPQKAFNKISPLRYSRTEVGAREVENLIGRLEHGVFS